MPSFISELRRRNVLRVAAAYALVAWIIIEAGSVLLPTFGASDAVFQTYVLIVLIGFIVSLVFAWIFEITPDGVKLDKDVDRESVAANGQRGLTNYVIIGLLIVALAISVTFNVTDIRGVKAQSAADIMMSRQSIAVLPFSSRSTNPENTLFADGVHDDLLTKLANIGSLRVISRTSVMEYRGTTKNLRQIGQESRIPRPPTSDQFSETPTAHRLKKALAMYSSPSVLAANRSHAFCRPWIIWPPKGSSPKRFLCRQGTPAMHRINWKYLITAPLMK